MFPERGLMWSRDAGQRLADIDETLRRCIDVGAAFCRHSSYIISSGKTLKNNDKRRIGVMITSSWRSGAYLTFFINIYGKIIYTLKLISV